MYYWHLGAIQEAKKAQEEFLCNFFLVGKKDEGSCMVINLKKLNTFISYEHFKMEGLHCLKFLPEQNDFMCKIDLKDAYFSILFSKQSSKYVRFKWSSNLYEFICLCFGLGLTPQVSTKLLKTWIIIVYLDDILLMKWTLHEVVTARDALIFLLQNLGSVMNLE